MCQSDVVHCFLHMLKAGLLMMWLIVKLCHDKPAFCICENKGADQLRGKHTADQLLYFLS